MMLACDCKLIGGATLGRGKRLGGKASTLTFPYFLNVSVTGCKSKSKSR